MRGLRELAHLVQIAVRERAERLVAVNTGACGLWLIGLLTDAEFAAVMNGAIDDETGRLV